MDPDAQAALRARVEAERQRRADEAAAEEERLRLEAEEALRRKHARFAALEDKDRFREQAESQTSLAMARLRAKRAGELLEEADDAHMSMMPKQATQLEAQSVETRQAAVETYWNVVLIAQESGDEALEAKALHELAMLRIRMAGWAVRVDGGRADVDEPSGTAQTSWDRLGGRGKFEPGVDGVKLEMAVQMTAARVALEGACKCYQAVDSAAGEAASSLTLGGVRMRLGDIYGAIEALERALALYQTNAGPGGGEDPKGTDRTLNTMRMIMDREGDMERYGAGTWIEHEGEDEEEGGGDDEDEDEDDDGLSGEDEDGQDKGSSNKRIEGTPAAGGAAGDVADGAVGDSLAPYAQAAEAELARRESAAGRSSISVGSTKDAAAQAEEKEAKRRKTKEANTLYVLANMRLTTSESRGYEGEAARAREAFENARTLYIEVGNKRAEANCLQLIGSANLRLAQSVDRRAHERADGKLDATGRRPPLRTAGILDEDCDEAEPAEGETLELCEQAIDALTEACALYEAVEATLGLANTLCTLCTCRVFAGGTEQLEKGKEDVERAASLYMQLGDLGNASNARTTQRYVEARLIAKRTTSRLQDEFDQARKDKVRKRKQQRKKYLAEKAAREARARGEAPPGEGEKGKGKKGKGKKGKGKKGKIGADSKAGDEGKGDGVDKGNNMTQDSDALNDSDNERDRDSDTNTSSRPEAKAADADDGAQAEAKADALGEATAEAKPRSAQPAREGDTEESQQRGEEFDGDEQEEKEPEVKAQDEKEEEQQQDEAREATRGPAAEEKQKDGAAEVEEKKPDAD
eukprot:g2558.t1